MQYLGTAGLYDIRKKKSLTNRQLIHDSTSELSNRDQAESTEVHSGLGEGNIGPYWLVCMQFYFEKMGNF